jgi:hypothetical protein
MLCGVRLSKHTAQFRVAGATSTVASVFVTALLGESEAWVVLWIMRGAEATRNWVAESFRVTDSEEDTADVCTLIPCDIFCIFGAVIILE